MDSIIWINKIQAFHFLNKSLQNYLRFNLHAIVMLPEKYEENVESSSRNKFRKSSAYLYYSFGIFVHSGVLPY